MMNAVAKTMMQVAGLVAALTINAAPAFCQQLASNPGRSLPPCRMDSFVYEAGAQAEQIYGDEGTTSIPPMFGFCHGSRINAGITGKRDQGLTTGHGSYMPSAWGADEFLAPPGEWSLSGANNGNDQYNNAAAGLDSADQQEAKYNNPSGGTGTNGAVTSGPGGVSPNPNFPPAPGEGYYSIVGCGGEFQGWMDPSLVQIGYTNWGLALYKFYTSSEFVGDPLEAQFEIGQIIASGALNQGGG